MYVFINVFKNKTAYGIVRWAFSRNELACDCTRTCACIAIYNDNIGIIHGPYTRADVLRTNITHGNRTKPFTTRTMYFKHVVIQKEFSFHNIYLFFFFSSDTDLPLSESRPGLAGPEPDSGPRGPPSRGRPARFGDSGATFSTSRFRGRVSPPRHRLVNPPTHRHVCVTTRRFARQTVSRVTPARPARRRCCGNRQTAFYASATTSGKRFGSV